MHDHLCENAVGQDPKRHSGGRKERDAAGLEMEVHEKSGRRFREEDKKKKEEEKEKAAVREMLPCVVGVADWAARTLGVCFTGPPSPSQVLSCKGTLAWRMRLGKKESRPPDKPALWMLDGRGD